MTQGLDLTEYGITVEDVLRNAAPAELYEEGVCHDQAVIASSGALATSSAQRTGRSPKDKRLVDSPATRDDIWWGDINIPISPLSFSANRNRAVEYLNSRSRLYVVDGFAGWTPEYRIKVRIICSRPYHALFMHNMLIRPTTAELQEFGQPDYVIFNAGACAADPQVPDVSSETSVALDFDSGEFVILGTQYAGEMKKGVFTIMNYLMPLRGVLSMHCSANVGESEDVSLFFGLSGTGKTTLSADPQRQLIGDDEHCWSDRGVFNIEGGCYAKCIDLSPEKEPEIYQAIRFGSVLENTVLAPDTRRVDYSDTSVTENTRAAYPIEHIANARIPCEASHPQNIILLTCDAFGVLPPVSRLNPAQAMYHFISGYTAKVAGTEVGVTEPQATFSACFGAAFLVLHPTRYAEMLAEKIREHASQAWLVNTGWSGGAYGTGQRMSLKHTRAIIDAIHDGSIRDVETVTDPHFGLQVPLACPGVPSQVLIPQQAWNDQQEYDATAAKLSDLFHENFRAYQGVASSEILSGQPNRTSRVA